MDGQLAHALAESLWGGRWLAGDTALDMSSFDDDNASAVLISSVDFVDPTGATHAGTLAWLTELRRQGVTSLRLVLGDEAPGFAIYADGPAPTVWVPSWTVGNFGDLHGRIWGVRYTTELLDAPLPPADLTIDDAADALEAAIARCLAFTQQQGFSDWASLFTDARRLLRASAPAIPSYPDLLAPGSALALRRLVAAAVTTQISGPMSAWPTLPVRDPRAHTEFVACAEQLEIASTQALVAATGGERRRRSDSGRTASIELPGFVKRLGRKRHHAPDAPGEVAEGPRPDAVQPDAAQPSETPQPSEPHPAR